MAFNIRMGLPEMEALWNDLSTRKQQGKLDKDEEDFSVVSRKQHAVSRADVLGLRAGQAGHYCAGNRAAPRRSKAWCLPAHQIIYLAVGEKIIRRKARTIGVNRSR
jgi:hypothetical protein